MDTSGLIDRARSVLNPRVLSSHGAEAASVGCAVLSSGNNIYTGVCIDILCGIGFCAEHTAIANMITNGESQIQTIVAVDRDGCVLAPCGRCRELIYQVHNDNYKAQVMMPEDTIMTLRDLLPHHWCATKETG
jgi:cytidine deaminase